MCPCKCDLPKTHDPTKIIVHGAREHNLKNICFEIPKGKLVALTGPSGSGKSSIAEVLQRECVRQYLESLGMTTDHISKAKVDLILGLSPSIGVPQRVTDCNPRSTVGTKTGILTILRNLFAAIGQQPGGGSEKLQMAHFSFNAADGMCMTCNGTGERIDVDLANVLNMEKTITNGGVDFWDKALSEYYERSICAAAKHYNFPFDSTLPIGKYTQEQRDFLLHGIKKYKNIKEPKKVSEGRFEGIISHLLKNPNKKYISNQPCSDCNGTRLGKIGREVTVAGKTIIDVAAYHLRDLLKWIKGLDGGAVLAALSDTLEERISNLIEVGLDYLTLDRTLPSLSGGELQRLRLAGLLGSGLTGILYVLDEPTTGLHPHDTAKLLKTLRKIQEAGNTVLVIEHDPDVIKHMDYIIDIGPGGGSKGGEIVAFGTPLEVMTYKKPKLQLEPYCRPNKILTIRDAREHNLKGIDVDIPVNQLVLLTGVSGSGKSTFLGILDKVARTSSHFNRVVTVDQATIRNTQSSRSVVATYTKLFDLIRDLFAKTPAAKIRHFGRDVFSFNTSNERCENCNGAGYVTIDMAFMPDVEVECAYCHGTRFSEEVLSVKFQGYTIVDILDMTVSDAVSVFREHYNIFVRLDTMKQVGLEYLTLGQSTSTLSGGEAQRIKLATELSKSSRESTLYLLDEPTTGLHPNEVDKLLGILRKIVSKGNTVVAIEHNIDVICMADTIIDFGPRGGLAGGHIIATGTPQEIAANKDSLTGQYLKTLEMH